MSAEPFNRSAEPKFSNRDTRGSLSRQAIMSSKVLHRGVWWLRTAEAGAAAVFDDMHNLPALI
jgi:hypothetical protein